MMSFMFPPASTLFGTLAVLVRALVPAVSTAVMLAEPDFRLDMEELIADRLELRFPS